MSATTILESLALGVDDLPSVSEAKGLWRAHRVGSGFAATVPPLLTPPGANHKLELGIELGQVAYGLALAPASLSGVNVCQWSTPECRAGCVSSAGMGRYDSVTRARVCKTRFLMEQPAAFLALLADEVFRARLRHGAALAVRLNTFSDLRWERIVPWLFEMFPSVRFYDYSKGWGRVRSLPANYHLTYSCSELTSETAVRQRVAMGENVAVVFSASRHKALPATWAGLAVHDGDGSDARYTDPVGVVVGLRAKGKMRSGTWAMVRG